MSPPPTTRYPSGNGNVYTDDNSTTIDYRGLTAGTASLIGGSGISLDGKSVLLPDDAGERDDVSSLNASIQNGAYLPARGQSPTGSGAGPDSKREVRRFNSKVQIIGTATSSKSNDIDDRKDGEQESNGLGKYQSPTSVNSGNSNDRARKQCIPNWIVRAPCWLKFAIALSMALLTGAVVLVAVALAATLNSNNNANAVNTGSMGGNNNNNNMGSANNNGDLPALFPPESASVTNPPQVPYSTPVPVDGNDANIELSTTTTATGTTVTATATTVTVNPSTSPPSQSIPDNSDADDTNDSDEPDESIPQSDSTEIQETPRPSLRPTTRSPTSIATTEPVPTQSPSKAPTSGSWLWNLPQGSRAPVSGSAANGTNIINNTELEETLTTAATAEPSGSPTTSQPTSAVVAPTQAPTLPPFESDITVFYVTGGRFTNDGLRNLPQQLRTLPPRGYSAFLVHLGDWNSPYATRCDQQSYQDVDDLFTNSSVPVYFLPGDNDFNDCQYPEQALAYWHEYLLDYESKHWPSPPHWQVSRHYPDYPENFAFVYNWVLYIGINLVGGVVHDENEWRTRQDANLEWIDVQYELNRRSIDGMVVFAHADPDVSSNDRFYDTFFERVGDDYSGMEVVLIHRNLGVESWSASRRYNGIDNLSVVVVEGSVWPPLMGEVNLWENRPFTFDQDNWYENYVEAGELDVDT